MLSFLQKPWPWFVSGPMITVVMGLLIFFGKTFGFSANLTNICSMMGLGRKIPYFRMNWKKQQWNLWFLVGAVIGGFIGTHLLKSPTPISISPATIASLQKLHIPFDGNLEPSFLFSLDYLMSAKGFLLFFGGGFLIGFGTRYAGGCTSGHAISGLSDRQMPSLIAVLGFFIGGLFTVHVLFPIIFK